MSELRDREIERLQRELEQAKAREEQERREKEQAEKRAEAAERQVQKTTLKEYLRETATSTFSKPSGLPTRTFLPRDAPRMSRASATYPMWLRPWSGFADLQHLTNPAVDLLALLEI
ncbi:hypothetical protein B0T17DRAFT_620499 [Bombardia bombarda]|uniref:Uncharacterized protein n=1 Tax=Bombardia bombarda TaxID=252184 RepID=A0AA39U6Y6_9PEZI|nr:hypothetical protein B0T17DRAFT_620499 [Bombardia bombarda]